MAESPSERRLRLIDAHAYNGFSLLALYDGWRYFEPPEIEGFIAYELHRNTAVVCGDPVCAAENISELLRTFAAYCAEHRWRFAFVSASARVGKIAAELDYQVVKIGEEPFLDLARPNLRGNTAKKARAAINHAKGLGVSAEEYREPSPATDREIEDVTQAWLASRKGPPMGFILRSRLLAKRERKRIFIARHEGRVVAAITCAPAAGRRMLYVEELARRPDAPYGAAELLIATARQAAVDEGAALFGLGLAPLLGASRQPYGRLRVVRLVIGLCYSGGAYLYNFRSLNHFKKKFAPTIWEDCFLIYENRLLPVALAIVAALAPDTIPSLILPERLQWLRRVPTLALWLVALGGILGASVLAAELPVLRLPAAGAMGTAHVVEFAADLLRSAADATLLAHRVISLLVLSLLAGTAIWRRRART